MKKATKKTTKKVVKKPLLENMSLENKVDSTLVIVEELRENFQAFGENIGGLWKEVIALRTRTESIFDETGRIHIELTHIKYRLDLLENNSGFVKNEIRTIKTDIAEIKKTFTTKADMKYITLFEARVARIEKKFA